MYLPQLAGRLLGTPLLLSRPKLDTLLAVLGERIGLSPMAMPGLAMPAMAPLVRPESSRVGAVAVVPVFGTLVRRTMGLEAASGLTSYHELSGQMRAAAADQSVRGILLELDSSGGEAGGVFEFATLVRAIAQEKPVWAIAADSAFSAAYAIACAATRVILTPTSGVGSIGVIAMHIDQSIRDAQQGYRFTAITAGAHKADLSPHAPAQPEALARLQREVDRLYGLFVEHVVAMRGLSAKAIRATEADLFFADAALSVGLADAVLGVDDTLAEFAQFLSAPHRTATQFGTGLNRGAVLLSHVTQKETTMSLDDQKPTPSPKSDGPLEPPVDATIFDSPDEESLPPAEPADAQTVTSAAQAAVAGAVFSTPKTYAHAAEIAEMCALANKTERTHGFLIKGLSVAQARSALLHELAAGEEIASVLPPLAPSAARAGNAPAAANPLLAAIAKLSKV